MVKTISELSEDLILMGPGMKWDNLRNDRCPACGSELESVGGVFRCTNYGKDGCGFYISKDKFEKLTKDS